MVGLYVLSSRLARKLVSDCSGGPNEVLPLGDAASARACVVARNETMSACELAQGERVDVVGKGGEKMWM